jgi:hypothetical protein
MIIVMMKILSNMMRFQPLNSIGYRLQHMSNGILYEHNPGLNMHMIEVGYLF